MFARPRPRKSTLIPPPKRRKINPEIQEINFDSNARSDYLTGFHKRKVLRTKRAQEEAAKKEKEEKILMRKQLREERKKELEEHVEAVNALVERDEAMILGFVDEGEESWEGFGDEGGREVVDHEEEYVDEDRYTTVTVEGVDVTKEGMIKTADEDEEDTKAQEKYKEAENKTEDGKKTWPKKPKKKKFRYESKTERKLTRAKQKSGNKAKATARRGE